MSSDRPRLHYQRELEVRYQTDVLVVGGGPAGVAAALAAARQGASVRLIEAHSCLGGMGTAGRVPAFMQFTDGVNFLADGIGRQILDALTATGGAFPWKDSTGIQPEALKRVYDQLLMEAGVPFTFHTRLVDVIGDEGQVHQAICAGKSGLFAIRATVFVDCTGDGDVAAFAGAPYEKGDPDGVMQAGTLCSLWSGLDWETIDASRYWGGTGSDGIEQAIEDGVFTVEDRALVGFWRVGATLGGGNIGHTFDLDGTDEESLTRAYVQGRKSMPEYERFYKEYREGYDEIELAATGSLMGVRETRRIMGDYVLTLDDYLRRAVFDDEIGRHSYNIDLHASKPTKVAATAARKQWDTLRLKEGESYGIPYRVLTPQGLANVLVAGRCVSTDRKVNGAIRVMPACYITGQAAGVAAAIASQGEPDVHAIDVRKLQARLRALGAYLPNLDGN